MGEAVFLVQLYVFIHRLIRVKHIHGNVVIIGNVIRRKDIMDYVKAFVVGGIICAIVQILMEKTKLMPGRIMVMLVCTGALLGAVGIYGPFSKWVL